MRLALAAALTALLPSNAPARVDDPGRLAVTALEWRLLPSRDSVPHGPVIVQLFNGGEDAHNLRLRRIGDHGRPLALNRVQPTELHQRTFALRRGTYRLWCSLPGHEKAGMHTTLRVR